MTKNTRKRPMEDATRNWTIYFKFTDNDWTQQELADKYDISRGRVTAIIRKCRQILTNKKELKMDNVAIKKTRNRQMTFSDRNWEIHSIRVNEGWTNQAIADNYGLTEARVRAIVKKCESILNQQKGD